MNASLERKKMILDRRALFFYFGSIPVAVLFILVMIFGILYPSSRVIEPPYLFPMLNTIFVAVVSLIVAYVAERSYLTSGSSPVLLLGAGVLVFGIGSLTSGWTLSRWGANVSTTLHNVPLLLAAIFHIVAVIVSSMELPPEPEPVYRRLKLCAAYIAPPVFVFFLFLLSINGMTPQFFVSEAGTTTLRQAVLTAAFVLFVYASSFIMNRFIGKKDPYLFWYSLALALLAVMSIAFRIQPTEGSPVGWIGRSAQYLAGIYFIVSVLSAKREAQIRGVPMSNAVAELLLSPGFHWHNILKTALNGFWITDARGNFLEVNDACCRILGYPRAELLSMAIADVEAVEGPLGVFRRIEVLQEKKTDHFISRHRRKDGTIVDVEVNASYHDIAGGQVVVFFQDVTERKRMELALRQSEEKFRQIADTMPQLVWTAGPDGKVDYVNSFYEKCTGLGPETAATLIYDLIHPDDAKLFNEAWRYAAHTGDTFEVEHRVGGNDREYRWFLTRGVSVRNGSGKIIKWYGTTTDIHDLRSLQEELELRVRERTEQLRKSEETYRLLFEENLAGVYRSILNPDTNEIQHLDCNEAYTRIIGYSREEFVAGGISTFVSEEDRKKYLNDLIGKKKLVNCEGRRLRKDGKPIWILMNASLRKMDQGDKLLIEGTIVDITARKEAEDDMKASHEKLRAMASEMVRTEEKERQHIATVLHDTVAQTLAATKINLEGLQEHVSSDGLEPMAAIRELLIQSIGQTRSIMAELSPPILNEIGFVPALEWLAEQVTEKHGISIEFDSTAEIGSLSHDIEVLLYQATRELLANIVKHAKAKCASIKVSEEDGKVKVEVIDDGIGLDKAKMGYHGDMSGGFGLFSIKERLKHFGGELTIQSHKNQGTRIAMMVPLRTQDNGSF